MPLCAYQCLLWFLHSLYPSVWHFFRLLNHKGKPHRPKSLKTPKIAKSKRRKKNRGDAGRAYRVQRKGYFLLLFRLSAPFSPLFKHFMPFPLVYIRIKLYLCNHFKTVFIRTVFKWATSGCSCMCSASIVSSITTGFYVSNSKWLMRNASYVTACCEHSCEQKIVYIERYERIHIETTTEHIQATSVRIETTSRHVDVPRRQRGDDE